ncbi:transposase [Alteribacillus sp. HJP-4]|uniref:transposase n=1 Tax=Alteribacillus sp. HJP-4 TaxID=2775394 RepID=UPI0035CCD89B
MSTYFRQESLFDLQELYDLEPTQRFASVFSSVSIAPLLGVMGKKTSFGRPVECNYPAMIYSLMARMMENIVTMKDLIKRLQTDLRFKRDCGFFISEPVPSEASYSRMITKISESGVVETINQDIVTTAITEGAITNDTNVAIDATHIEARDQAPKKKTEKRNQQPKKRGRKPKAERNQWLKEKREKEESLPLYEKRIEAQLDVPYDTLHKEMPLTPRWGVKKNSESQNVWWFGYKVHLAVDTNSQMILHSMMSSGNLNDGKAAIPLLKGINHLFPRHKWSYAMMDAGYDYEPVYKQIHAMNRYSLIAYNKRREPEPVGFDRHFAPTCVREHSYRYDSFDPKYKTVKYTRPKECKDCPLAHDSLCQKVFKMKIETHLRRYSSPARGSKAWETLYKQRSSVERVNGYLKEHFPLDNIRHRTGQKAKAHVDMVTLIYNSMKLANFRLKTKQAQTAA